MQIGNIIKNNIFLLLATLISFLIAVFSFLYFSTIYYSSIPAFLKNLIFFIPTFFIILFSYISCKIPKYPKTIKIIASILNILIILWQCFFLFTSFSLSSLFNDLINEPEYTNIVDYQKALNCFKCGAISYFPKEIPQDAKNIYFLKTPSSFLGDTTFYLKFDINKDYIKKEYEKNSLYGKEIIFNNRTKMLKPTDEYELHRTETVLNELGYKDISLKIKIMENNSCFGGIVFGNSNIAYFMYCD